MNDTKDITTVEVDEKLVEEACNKIVNLFSKHMEKAVLDTGYYLIEKFFDNNFENASKTKKIENSSDGNTLNQVFERFKRTSSDSEETSPGPSKSWLYDAINIAVQDHHFKALGEDNKSFQTYGKLLLSHKKELCRLKDIEDKEEFLETPGIENMSFRQFKDELSDFAEKKGIQRSINPGFLTIINKPEMLEWEQSKEKLELEALKNKNKETLEKYQGRLKQKRTELNDELKEFETKKEKYQQYLDRFEKIEKDIKEAMKTAKKKKSRNQKKEGIN
jgi:hypothetical protein